MSQKTPIRLPLSLHNISPLFPLSLYYLPISIFLTLSTHITKTLNPSLSLLSLSTISISDKRMLLGKRARPPIKRTTSMTGITAIEENPSDLAPTETAVVSGAPDYTPMSAEEIHDQYLLMSMISPRPQIQSQQRSQRRNSASDFVETADFLRTCGLCNRRLVSGRDIYMYMGDTAFCSLECREKQMKKDERREGCTARKSGETSSSNKPVPIT